MTYCSECGTDVEDASFCPDCGTAVGESTASSDDVGTDAEVEEILEDEDEGVDYKLATTSVIMAIIVGIFVAWSFLNIGGAGFLFVATVVGVTYYLYSRKTSARSAVGSGLYITALWMVVTPIFFYLPLFMGADEGTAEGAGQAIGSIAGLFIWGIVFFILAVVVFVIGFFVNRGVEE